MSDIFISYKREEQPIARKLANALESEGWSVWWDPKVRAGEHFDDVIEKALDQAECVIVMLSKRSVQSRYVRDEATFALDRDKLVPVAIENVNLPFRFRGVHTLSLLVGMAQKTRSFVGWSTTLQQLLVLRQQPSPKKNTVPPYAIYARTCSTKTGK